jgi:hypothetical protein
MRFEVLPGEDEEDCDAGVSAALLMPGVAMWALGHSNGSTTKGSVDCLCYCGFLRERLERAASQGHHAL